MCWILALLLQAFLLGLFALLRQMVTNDTAHRRTDYGMVMSIMSGHRAGDGSLNAAFGLCWNGRECDGKR